MQDSLHLFEVLSWTLLPTVMFGGFSLLHWLRGKLSEEQTTFFRAGHAHAGVLLIMSLIFYIYLAKTPLSWQVQNTVAGILLSGILLQSGGFFYHAFLDKDDREVGLTITKCGALLLAVAVVVLVYGLLV